MTVKCPITWNSMRVYAVTIFFGENFQKKKNLFDMPNLEKTLYGRRRRDSAVGDITMMCRSSLFWLEKRARFKVQLHFSSLNMYYTTIVKGPSYIFDASFFRMPLPPRKYIYENYFARGLTHQFSIDHHTLIHTQYTLKIPKKVHSFFFHLWVVPKFLCSKNNSVLPFLSF